MKNKKAEKTYSRILFLADGCHPGTQGGVQTFGRALKKMFPKDVRFLAWKTKNEIIFNVDDVTEILSINIIYRALDKFSGRKIRKYLNNRAIKYINPEVCILRSPCDLNYLEDVDSKKILVQHINFERYFESYYRSDKELLDRSKKELDYFVVLSEYDKNDLVKRLKFPKEKVKVIRHACDIEIREDIKQKNKNLIMIARIDNTHKRFDLAIKAMKKLPGYNLKIYGSGSDMSYLQNLIKTEKLNNVELCGPTNQVKSVLDEGGIFVMTSDFEAYGITNIEAMRRGLPIILRDTFPAARDIINHNGILLAREWDEDAFVEGIKNIYDNYEVYTANSIKQGHRHDWDVIQKEWEALFVKSLTID